MTPNAFLRLPFVFDVDLLRRDLDTCLSSSDWARHVNTRDYSGEWTGIALRSNTGHASDIVAHPTSDGYRDTPLLACCSYFRHVLRHFECCVESARLLRLAAGSRINQHRDRGECYASGAFRLHVPIQTHSLVSFWVDACVVPMKSGECWYADVDRPHEVSNDSSSDRIHLVVDCRRNAWSDAVFRAAGYDFAEEARRRVDQQTRRRTIEELRHMNTSGARRLIEELTKEGDV
jgi:aspartyl/asparaginyl beta-hydroxylase